jgi:Rieske Fe-S protein
MSSIPRRDLPRGALSLTAIDPLCCVTPELSPKSVEFAAGRIIVDLRRAPELRRTGAAFAIVDQNRKINLILAHAEHHRYVALDRACTHNGAMCTYNRKRQTFQCTSLNHAEYDLRGTLLHGRTHGNLRAYEVDTREPLLTIWLRPKS